MQQAQGLWVKQAADKDATSQMQGYLSDLYCTYAGNRVSTARQVFVQMAEMN